MPMVFVLGAEDPEMVAIRETLKRYGIPYLDAHDAEGHRVNPRTAYWADPTDWPSAVFLVECASADGPRPYDVVIDHHDPAIHPAARLGAADCWQAASIGQVWRILAAMEIASVWPPAELRLVAAMDHCLPAAYAGQCPGIDPADVFERDLVNVAAAPGGRGDPEYVRGLIEAASAAIRACPTLDMAGQTVYDGRGLPFIPQRYSAESLASSKAMSRDGIAALASVADADGRRKITIGGAAAPETVSHFMEVFAPSLGLTDIYGVPARGFAGGYLPEAMPVGGNSIAIWPFWKNSSMTSSPRDHGSHPPE